VLLYLALPRIVEPMSCAFVDAVYVEEDARLGLGAKLIDLTVDLSAGAAHDCPPISHYRIALRDEVWARRLLVAAGDEVAVGAPLALFSTEADEPLDGPPARAARISVIGIIGPSFLAGGRS